MRIIIILVRYVIIFLKDSPDRANIYWEKYKTKTKDLRNKIIQKQELSGRNRSVTYHDIFFGKLFSRTAWLLIFVTPLGFSFPHSKRPIFGYEIPFDSGELLQLAYYLIISVGNIFICSLYNKDVIRNGRFIDKIESIFLTILLPYVWLFLIRICNLTFLKIFTRYLEFFIFCEICYLSFLKGYGPIGKIYYLGNRNKETAIWFIIPFIIIHIILLRFSIDFLNILSMKEFNIYEIYILEILGSSSIGALIGLFIIFKYFLSEN